VWSPTTLHDYGVDRFRTRSKQLNILAYLRWLTPSHCSVVGDHTDYYSTDIQSACACDFFCMSYLIDWQSSVFILWSHRSESDLHTHPITRPPDLDSGHRIRIFLSESLSLFLRSPASSSIEHWQWSFIQSIATKNTPIQSVTSPHSLLSLKSESGIN